MRLLRVKSSRLPPDFFLIFRKPPLGEQAGLLAENLSLHLLQMAAAAASLLYNQSERRKHRAVLCQFHCN